MYQFVNRKKYVLQEVCLFRELMKQRSPNEFDLAVEANQPDAITAEEWAEAKKELDGEK